MENEFVLPPRRRLTLKERRKNADREFAWHMWRFGRTGLHMVHQLKDHNPEMRWLSELFPLGQDIRFSQKVAEQRLSEWCAAHPEDATALVLLARVRLGDGFLILMEKAAAMGNARAMAHVSFHASDDRRFQLACASAAQDDADGTYRLMECFRDGIGCRRNAAVALELLERAVDLGSDDAYLDLRRSRVMDHVESVKLLISFFGMHSDASKRHHFDLVAVLQRHFVDGSDGDLIFEVGELFKGNVDSAKGMVFGREVKYRFLKTFNEVVSMYDGWCDLVRESCVSWVLCAKQTGFNKDVRRKVARLIWEARRKGIPLIVKEEKVVGSKFAFIIFLFLLLFWTLNSVK